MSDQSSQRTAARGRAPTTADITPRLTISIEGPDVVELRELDTSGLGPIPTPEQAVAIRPRIDDPTHLENGDLHPYYAEWIIAKSWAERYPLNEYLTSDVRLRAVADERGYFDRKRANKVLGKSGSEYWQLDGPLPTKAKILLLADLLGASSRELEAVIGQEKRARADYQSVVSRCRNLPMKLLTYEQIMAGVPCPGCGRPWIGPQDKIDTDDAQWRALHGDCHAGRNGYTGSPVHCMRCCGVPSLSPQQIASVMRIFQDAADREAREEDHAAISPEGIEQRRLKAIAKRAKRIKHLERELDRLRVEEAGDRD